LRASLSKRLSRDSKASFAAILAACCLTACGGPDTGLVSHRLFAMATWVDIDLPAPDANNAELLARIEADLRQFERDYYAWGDGELAALNRSLTDNGSFRASAPLAALLERAQEITILSAGTFDPGVGELVALWGFDGGSPDPVPPDPTRIAESLEVSGSLLDLVIDGAEIRVADASNAEGDALALRFTLDLGGIAKGAAVDRIVGQLQRQGVTPALINAGGDLRVIGERRDRRWRVGIQSPRSDDLIGVVDLESGEAAFTSGDYERYYELDGERMHHILDPRTGYPVNHTQAVTVIGADGTIADAAATAVFVAGPDDWRTVARKLGIEAVLRVDANGRIEMTDAMRDRFQLLTGTDSDILAADD
jgi:thiamine biosynthesis lipoprotein